MYPVGILFGLGFDTASEAAAIAITAGAATTGLPFYSIICLPIIFAAGMSLLDTLDGAFMMQAYGWAFSNPVRKVYYNITVTGLSVAVAFIIGTVEVLQVVTDHFGLAGGVWNVVGALNLNVIGIAIVALFVLTWGVAWLVWKYSGIEERWTVPNAG